MRATSARPTLSASICSSPNSNRIIDTRSSTFAQARDLSLQLLMGIEKPAGRIRHHRNIQAPDVTITLAQAEQDALAARPDYLAARQGVTVADANVKLADAGGTTDPTIGGASTERTATYRQRRIPDFIPVRIFDRNQGEKERTRFEAQSSRFAEIAARKPGAERRRSGLGGVRRGTGSGETL